MTFVTQLDTNAGSVLSATEKANLVAALGATPADPAKRASVLRAVAEDQDLKNAEKNKAFVLMQYFGYLRRNPERSARNDSRFRRLQFLVGETQWVQRQLRQRGHGESVPYLG